MSMNEHTKHFQVMIDSKGRPTVRVLPGIDTGEQVIFDKEELVEELTTLFKRAANVGWQLGRLEVRKTLREALGIKE